MHREAGKKRTRRIKHLKIRHVHVLKHWKRFSESRAAVGLPSSLFRHRGGTTKKSTFKVSIFLTPKSYPSVENEESKSLSSSGERGSPKKLQSDSDPQTLVRTLKGSVQTTPVRRGIFARSSNNKIKSCCSSRSRTNQPQRRDLGSAWDEEDAIPTPKP